MAFGSRSVEVLLDEVKHLPPADLRVFASRFGQWHRRTGSPAEQESALIGAAKCRLPRMDEQRLRRLIAKSERGTLTGRELQEYRVLARRCEQLNVVRLQALAELSGLRGKPVSEVMEEIGWEGTDDEA